MIPLSEYIGLSSSELQARIAAVRHQSGSRLTILAHYYCMDDVVAVADYVGDSLGLAQNVAKAQTEAVLFCGVYFMTETADIILNLPERIAQRNGVRLPVMMPDIDAGCPMADMVTPSQAVACRNAVDAVVSFDQFMPITYINSSAATKAFVGRCGGYVCTSANARKVIDKALSQRDRILFLPDEHLGRNTANEIGIPKSEIFVWDPNQPQGGLTVEQIQSARVLLWKGFCPIHQRFSTDIIRETRQNNPDAQVWVHPESPESVVRLADGYGSTTKLINVVENAPAGSVLSIGTEWKLVERLKNQYPDKKFVWPGQYPSVCTNMAKSTLPKIACVLENWLQGLPMNVVSVDADTAQDANIALQNMLANS